jgi:uncharacterized protein
VPPITLWRLVIIALLNLLVGYYLYRKTVALFVHYKFKRLAVWKSLSAITMAVLMMMPALALLTRRFDNLREEDITYAMFTLASMWFIWVLVALSLFLLFDAVKYYQQFVQRLRDFFRRKPVISAESFSTPQVVTDDQKPLLTRRKFLTLATSGATPLLTGFAAPSLITAYSVFNNRTNYIVNEMTLSFPNLPSELRGLKIAQVSDIHSGLYMPQRKMEEIAETVNSFHPDVITLTGDFVSSFTDEIDPFAKGFANLKSTYGTFACSGNHDEWTDIEVITEVMQKHGQNILRNQTETIRIGAATLNIIGMDYTHTGTWMLDKAMKTAEPEGFNLLLCHHPDFFTYAKDYGIDLMLAGHTHGGQIALDFGGFEFYPIDLFYKYPRGLFEEGNALKAQKLYVNLGIGITATPLRTVQPEIAIITLT